MDGWLLFHGHGDVTESSISGRSYGSAAGGGLHQEKYDDDDDGAISLQLQRQLKQIHMLMMDTESSAAVPASSSSSTFPSSGSPDEMNSPLIMLTTSCHHQPVDVSSPSLHVPPIAYDHRGLLYGGNLDDDYTIEDLVGELIVTQEVAHPEQPAAQSKYGRHESGGGAFRPYVRHLSPRKTPKPGACGQRAFKAAMSTLARMHEPRLAHWRSCLMEMAAAAAPSAVASNPNQVQHVLSERKRREKLNGSFKDLRAVLPPGPKKDRASTLIRARDYVNTLKSRVSELEEENRMLVESLLYKDNDGGEQDDDYPGEQIDVDPTNAETSQEFRLKLVVGSAWNAMDGVVTILRCLREIEDVRLVGVDTGGSGSDGLSPGNDLQIANVTLQVTSTSRCDDSLLKESVIKTVKDATKSEAI